MFEKLLRLMEILGEKAPVVIPIILELLRAFNTGGSFAATGPNVAVAASDFGAEDPAVQKFVDDSKKHGVDEAQARELALMAQRVEGTAS